MTESDMESLPKVLRSSNLPLSPTELLMLVLAIYIPVSVSQHLSRQRLPDFRWRRRGSLGSSFRRQASRSPHPREVCSCIGHRRPPAHHGHWPSLCNSKGPRKDRSIEGRHLLFRDQRGVRQPGCLLRGNFGHPVREGKCPWWCYRHWSSPRVQ